jgi:hypothetical protein
MIQKKIKKKGAKLRKFGKIDILVGAKMFKMKIPKHDLDIIKKEQEASMTSLQKYLEEKEKTIRLKQVKGLIFSNISVSCKFIKPKIGTYFIRLFHTIFYNNILEQLFYNNYIFFCQEYIKKKKLMSILYVKQLINSIWYLKKNYINLNTVYTSKFIDNITIFAKSKMNLYSKFDPIKNITTSILEELEFFFNMFTLDKLDNILQENINPEVSFSLRYQQTSLPFIQKLPFKSTMLKREFLLMSELNIVPNPYKLIDILKLRYNLSCLNYSLDAIYKIIKHCKNHNYVVNSIYQMLKLPQYPEYMEIKNNIVSKIYTNLDFFNILDVEYTRTFSQLHKKIKYDNKPIIDFVYFGLDKLKELLNIKLEIYQKLLDLLEKGLIDINIYFQFLVELKNIINMFKMYLNLYALCFIRDFMEFLYYFMELIFFVSQELKIEEQNINDLGETSDRKKYTPYIIKLYKEKFKNFNGFKYLNFLKYNFWNRFENFHINYEIWHYNLYNLMFKTYFKNISVYFIKNSNYIKLSEYLGFDTSSFVINTFDISDLKILSFPYFYKKYIGYNIYENLDNLNRFNYYMFPSVQRFNLYMHKLKLFIKHQINLLRSKILTYIDFYSVVNLFDFNVFNTIHYIQLTSDMLKKKIYNTVVQGKLKLISEQISNYDSIEVQNFIEVLKMTIKIFYIYYYTDNILELNVNDDFYLDKDLLKNFNIKSFLESILKQDLEIITDKNYQSFEEYIISSAKSVDSFFMIDNFSILQKKYETNKIKNTLLNDEEYIFNVSSNNYSLKDSDFFAIKHINTLNLLGTIQDEDE